MIITFSFNSSPDFFSKSTSFSITSVLTFIKNKGQSTITILIINGVIQDYISMTYISVLVSGECLGNISTLYQNLLLFHHQQEVRCLQSGSVFQPHHQISQLFLNRQCHSDVNKCYNYLRKRVKVLKYSIQYPIVRRTHRHLFWCLTFSSSGSMFEAVDIHRYMLLKVNHLPSCKQSLLR